MNDIEKWCPAVVVAAGPCPDPLHTRNATRFSEWTAAGLFTRLLLARLDLLGQAGQIDRTRCSLGSTRVRALKRGT